MPLFDDAMFAPQQGIPGWLGELLKMAAVNPTPSRGFQQQQPDAAQLPMNAQPTQGMMPRMGAQQMPGAMPVGAMPEQMGQPYSMGPNPFMPQAGGMQQAQMQQGAQQGGGMQQQPQMGQQRQSSPFFGEGGSLQNGLYNMAAIMNPSLAPQMNAIQNRNMQNQSQQATYKALVDSNVPEPIARAAAMNPEVLKTIAGNYFDTKPQFVPNASHDQYGNPVGGFVEPAKKKVTLIGQNGQAIDQSGAGGQNAMAGQQSDLHGDEYLKTLDPQKADIVKGIAEGRIPYPSGFVMKTPYGQWLTGAVSQYKPGLTAQDFATIQQTRKNYTSGPSFQEIKAINTAIGHAAKLYGFSEQMGGSDTLPGYVNPVIQGAKNNFPSLDPNFQNAKKNYDALSETLSTEISKALNGGTPHVADKEHWRSIFSNADGPEQRRAAIKAGMAILEGRFGPLQQGYEQGMKGAGEPLNIVNPENQATFDRLLAGKNPGAPSQGAPQLAAPKPGQVQQGYRFKGGDPSNKMNWERVQ